MTDTPHVHANPNKPELHAMQTIEPHICGMKRDIMARLKTRLDQGLTPDEYQRMTGAIINTVRRRFVDLHTDGLIKPTAEARKNTHGNDETVWVLGRDEFVAERRKDVVGRIVGFEGVGGPSAFGPEQKIHVIVEMTRREWEQVKDGKTARFR